MALAAVATPYSGEMSGRSQLSGAVFYVRFLQNQKNILATLLISEAAR